MAQKKSNLVDVGRIATSFGVKGWVKIHSYTDPGDNIFAYSPWLLKTKHGVKEIELLGWKPHGKGFVAQLKGVEDKDQADLFHQVTIAVDRSNLPQLDAGEYYWHQLEGLRVYTLDNQLLGEVERMMATGANDVFIVKPCEQSVDDQERLIPYVPDHFKVEVNLEEGALWIDWDPSF